MGDVQSIELRRDGAIVPPIATARVAAVPNEPAYQAADRRVFAAGIAVYRPQDFAARPDRSAPSLEVIVTDAARERRRFVTTLPPATLAAIARDLRGFQR